MPRVEAFLLKGVRQPRGTRPLWPHSRPRGTRPGGSRSEPCRCFLLACQKSAGVGVWRTGARVLRLSPAVYSLTLEWVLLSTDRTGRRICGRGWPNVDVGVKFRGLQRRCRWEETGGRIRGRAGCRMSAPALNSEGCNDVVVRKRQGSEDEGCRMSTSALNSEDCNDVVVGKSLRFRWKNRNNAFIGRISLGGRRPRRY